MAPSKPTSKGKASKYSYKVSKVRKYDGKSTFAGMGVDRKFVDALCEAGNQNLDKNSWRKHATAEGYIRRYEMEVGGQINFS